MYSVSLIIPVYNEEQHIEQCLNSILNFSGLDEINYEILIVDGMSDDKTLEIIHKYSEGHAKIKLIVNPLRIQSCALNLGISVARYDYIMRLDAHCKYPSDYLQKSIETSIRSGADNVGGIIITHPGGDTYSAKLVQALTTHKFGVGNSGFRTGAHEGDADTVPFGFFRKDIFSKIGLFDEKLIRCQDYEFNKRIVKNGGSIWMNPLIQSHYFNQPTLWKFLKKQITKEAPFNPYMWYLHKYTFSYRHAITGAFVLFFFLGLFLSFFISWIKLMFISVMILYAFLAFFSSVQQAVKYREFFHVFTLPFSFFLFHMFHGVGIWIGICKLILGTAPVQKHN
jgi:glycosyltransferase involved in cell wall biosynthesis